MREAKLIKKIGEYDAQDACRICGKPLLKGQEIEILIEGADDNVPRTTSVAHAGQCMSSYLAWRNTVDECASEASSPYSPNVFDCAVKKTEEEHGGGPPERD